MSLEVKQEGSFKYIEEGEGEVLLLLHGLFGALSNWKDVTNHFSDRYKVVIPLMPIFEMNILKLSVHGLADFIHDFIEFKKFDQVNLLGNSLGGHVALVYVRKHPEKVKTMLLTGSSGLYENAMGGNYPKKGDKEFIRKKVEITFYDPKTATDELVDEVFETINDRMKILRILTMAKSAIRHNMRKDIPQIKIPVCLIWGKDDIITPPTVGEEFHELLPQSELHLLAQCGHAPMMERPNEFNTIADKFYTKHLG
ncbi:MAG: alpha/beta hydrolase [Bacteroidia bacterium]|jgi:pimeloyl-ACP methyl ester carboxylesterase|nr:alpha/beta hydrolase [Bacteroidia bacterium]